MKIDVHHYEHQTGGEEHITVFARMIGQIVTQLNSIEERQARLQDTLNVIKFNTGNLGLIIPEGHKENQ